MNLTEKIKEIEREIFLDTRYSMKEYVEGGATKSDLKEITSRGEIKKIQKEMQKIFEKRNSPDRFDTDLSVINSPYDSDLRKKIKETLEDIKNIGIDVRHVVLAGIGGSELGATALISACGRKDINYHPITSLDNDNISIILGDIEPEKAILIEVSRSGATKETLTAYSVIKKYLEEKLGKKHKQHCVAILGKDKQDVAKQVAGHYKICIEPTMSGRFTVFHAANLFTMALFGIDTEAFHSGARYILEKCINAKTLEENDALQVAALKYYMNTKKGKVILNNGVFSPLLVKYGDWLDQLTEESLGHNDKIALCVKTTELSNKLHSDLQNWLAGGNIFYHQFVFPLASKEKSIENPSKQGEKLSDIELAAYLGTVESLAKNGRPSFTTFMHSINEKAMGQLMMRDMLSTIYLGELFRLGNEEGIKGKGYFNQPGVQRYKDIMKNFLDNHEKLERACQKILKI